jgi:Arc/MetJ-type ribon-helix-helix transcriptional regulator
MSSAKIAITLERQTLREIDHWVKEGRFPSRSRAIQIALLEMTTRQRRRRLVEELSKIDRKQEQALADAFFFGETSWPEY